MDFGVALTAGIFLLPLLLIVALIIKLTDSGPVLFKHARIGFQGRAFYCLKFRTMAVDSAEKLERLLATDEDARQEWEANHKLRNDPRVTRIGMVLRRSSVDELPQLFNVLLGHMSLVGPRPIVFAEAERYKKGAYETYISALPGITGLWQVSGRSDTTYDERIRLDCEYIDHWSLLVDLRIMLKTLVVVSKAKGSC
jgi:exopolysaccharide production protein ExoY